MSGECCWTKFYTLLMLAEMKMAVTQLVLGQIEQFRYSRISFCYLFQINEIIIFLKYIKKNEWYLFGSSNADFIVILISACGEIVHQLGYLFHFFVVRKTFLVLRIQFQTFSHLTVEDKTFIIINIWDGKIWNLFTLRILPVLQDYSKV